MKVKIPKQIKIGGRTYKLRLNDHLIRDEGNRGCVYWHTQIINLDSNMEQEPMSVSFLHELVHAIDEHYCGRTGLSEEATCGLSEGLYQFLKDNLGIEFDWSLIKE